MKSDGTQPARVRTRAFRSRCEATPKIREQAGRPFQQPLLDYLLASRLLTLNAEEFQLLVFQLSDFDSVRRMSACDVVVCGGGGFIGGHMVAEIASPKSRPDPGGGFQAARRLVSAL